MSVDPVDPLESVVLLADIELGVEERCAYGVYVVSREVSYKIQDC